MECGHGGGMVCTSETTSRPWLKREGPVAQRWEGLGVSDGARRPQPRWEKFVFLKTVDSKVHRFRGFLVHFGRGRKGGGGRNRGERGFWQGVSENVAGKGWKKCTEFAGFWCTLVGVWMVGREESGLDGSVEGVERERGWKGWEEVPGKGAILVHFGRDRRGEWLWSGQERCRW